MTRPELIELGEPASGLVVVEGPPGSGKSTLLEDLIRRLGQGRRVLAAGCGRLDGGCPYGLLGQLFEPLLTCPESASLRDLLDPFRDTENQSGLQDAAERVTRELLKRAPLLICVDDAHWGDGPSLACLARLSRRSARQPVLIALTRCPQVLGTPADGLAELLLRPDCVMIQPALLSQRQVGALIGTMLQASPLPDFTAFCHRATRGNPQMLIELIRAISETGIALPAGSEARFSTLVAEIGARRATELLRRQPGELRDLVEVLAVLGERALDVAADLTQLDPAQVKHSLGELVKLGLLRQAGANAPAFASERLLAAVRGWLPAAARDELRVRAARALSLRGAPVEHVAAVLRQTRPAGDPWVIEVLCEAARVRMATGYPDEVAGYLQRVLQEQLEPAQRAALLLQLGAVQLPGDPEAAERHFRESARLATGLRLHAAALTGFCQAGLLMQRPLEVTPELARAIEDLAAIEDMTDADREALLRLGAMLVIASENPLSESPVSESLLSESPVSESLLSEGVLPESAGGPRRVTPAECELLSAFAWRVCEQGGGAEEAAGLALRAMSGTSLWERESHGLFIRSVSVLLHADHLDTAMEWAGRMAEAGSRHRWPLFQLAGRCLRAEAAFRMGELELSLGEARAAFGSSGLAGRSAYHVVALASLTRALIELDRLDEAEGLLGEHGTVLTGTPRTRITYLAARGRLLARQGDLDGALHDTLEAGRLLGTLQIDNPAVLAWRSQAAVLYAERGSLARARELADEELSRARAWGAPRAIGIALRARGKAEECVAGLSLLEEAVQVLASSPARLELAGAYAELGVRHRMLGATAPARQALRNGAAVAEQCGAHGLVTRIRAELLLSGARPRAVPQSGPAALTPSERRVAVLAARGLTNRQIAHGLTISPNTVEVHLTSAYRKLAISGRAQLADVLAGRARIET